MTAQVVLAALAAGVAVALAVPTSPARSPRRPGAGPGPVDSPDGQPDEAGLGPPVRILVGACVAACCWALLGGLAGIVLGLGAGAWTVRASAQVGRGPERARTARARADLPVLVGLFAAGLRAGAPAPDALDRACVALPGPASERLGPVRARLRLGVSPEAVWSDLAGDEVLGPLGRSLARAQRTGAPVAAMVEDLAATLAAEARSAVEDRARAVGVRAALPLGLCLLPGFLLLGIVPLVAALVAGLDLGTR